MDEISLDFLTLHNLHGWYSKNNSEISEKYYQKNCYLEL